jgi:hypothetical protein
VRERNLRAIAGSVHLVGVVESRRTITFDEYFTGITVYSEAVRKAMIQAARMQPTQFVALIEYEALDSLGAPFERRRHAPSTRSKEMMHLPARIG